MWNRLVQMIKRVFLLNLGSARLYRDLFITIVAETEGSLNGRPTTQVNSDVAVDLPLTPNHFLLGRPFVYKPSAAFSEQPTSKSWRLVKEKMNCFWRRLLKEYASPETHSAHEMFTARGYHQNRRPRMKTGGLHPAWHLATWTNHRDFHRA